MFTEYRKARKLLTKYRQCKQKNTYSWLLRLCMEVCMRERERAREREKERERERETHENKQKK